MTVRIGVFGCKQLVDRVEKLARSHDRVEIVPFAFISYDEIEHLIERAFTCDVYLFASPLAYFFGKRIIKNRQLPTVHVSIDEYAILKALYHLMRKSDQMPNQLSIDIKDEQYLKNAIVDLQMNDETFHTYEYKRVNDVTIDTIVDFHSNLWEKNKVDMTLTTSTQVAKRLADKNIPVQYIKAPKKYIHQAIEQAKNKVISNKQLSNRMVVKYIHPSHMTNNENISKETLNTMAHYIRTHSQSLDVSLIKQQKQFILIGTNKLHTYITNHLKKLPLLEQLEEIVPENVSVHIGAGYGLTVKAADKNAQLALKRCQERKESRCYIVNERQEYLGPIGIERPFDQAKLYNELIHQARLNNQISYNFIQFIENRNNEPFSSEDIAEHYQVTKRSAERTISKLIDGNIIISVGEERPYVQGRPRKLFQLQEHIME